MTNSGKKKLGPRQFPRRRSGGTHTPKSIGWSIPNRDDTLNMRLVHGRKTMAKIFKLTRHLGLDDVSSLKDIMYLNIEEWNDLKKAKDTFDNFRQSQQGFDKALAKNRLSPTSSQRYIDSTYLVSPGKPKSVTVGSEAQRSYDTDPIRISNRHRKTINPATVRGRRHSHLLKSLLSRWRRKTYVPESKVARSLASKYAKSDVLRSTER